MNGPAIAKLRRRTPAFRIRPIYLFTAILSLAFAGPALSTALDSSWRFSLSRQTPEMAASESSANADKQARARHISWRGEDVDGDGAPDIANPTGQSPRSSDAYGSGAFGAPRDHGSRHHAGVDYIVRPGQAVWAPISGFVSKIGHPYADGGALRYVEIVNPALKLSARVFYVDPTVKVGDPVSIQQAIGVAQSLQDRYPGGITDHVHLEIADAAGRKLDPSSLILAQLD
jgi:murein DD-endopeptidase MepM/ murein hydrolase activator NlpD